jgi:hypothetical protein
MKNNFAALVPNLPVPSLLGLPVSATAVLTLTVTLSLSLAPFPISGSDGALPAVGGLDLSLGAAGVCYPASCGPVKGSTNCVSCKRQLVPVTWFRLSVNLPG